MMLADASYIAATIDSNDRAPERCVAMNAKTPLPVVTQEDATRACQLMRTYADAPMDFADASLVVAAEAVNITRVLTLDGHFYAYRINQKTPFEVLP